MGRKPWAILTKWDVKTSPRSAHFTILTRLHVSLCCVLWLSSKTRATLLTIKRQNQTNVTVQRVFSRAWRLSQFWLFLLCYGLWLWLDGRIRATLLPKEMQNWNNATLPRTFSRAWHRLHRLYCREHFPRLAAVTSDCRFTALVASVVITQSNNFGFTELDWNLL